MPDVLGYVALHLHAHLPYVRHPEHEDFLEEDWLYEAITETYLPLLQVFDRLTDEGVPFRISITMTPPLVAMLRDELLMAPLRAPAGHALRARPTRRSTAPASDPDLPRPGRSTTRRVPRAARPLRRALPAGPGGRLPAPGGRGRLEIVTCAATHGFLPLMQQHPEAVRAQIAGGGGALPAPLRPRSGRHLAARVRLLPRPRRAAGRGRASATSSSTPTASPTPPRARATASSRPSSRPAGWPPSAATRVVASRSGAPRPATPAIPTTASSTGTSAGTSTAST